MSEPIQHGLNQKSIKLASLAGALSGLLALIVVFGLHSFVRYSFQSIPSIEEAPQHDLTVVLAGGRGRISQALEMIAHGRSKRMLIVGAGEGITLDKIIPETMWPVGVSKDLVDLENESDSTYENALKVREVVLFRRLKDVTIVTSFYHALRTRLIMERILPRWTTIHLVGVSSKNFQKEDFWTHSLSLRIGLVECLKYAWYWMMVPRIL